MNHIFATLEFYLSFPFARYALIVGVLVALCAALLGVIEALLVSAFIIFPALSAMRIFKSF